MSHTEAQRTQRKDKKSMIKIGKITNYAEKNVNRQMKDAHVCFADLPCAGVMEFKGVLLTCPLSSPFLLDGPAR